MADMKQDRESLFKTIYKIATDLVHAPFGVLFCVMRSRLTRARPNAESAPFTTKIGF